MGIGERFAEDSILRHKVIIISAQFSACSLLAGLPANLAAFQ